MSLWIWRLDLRPLTTADSQPPRNKTQKSTISLGRNRSNPMVHAPLGRITRHKLGQRSAKKALQNRHENEAVDNSTWSTGIDFGDYTQSKSGPGNGSR